MTHQNHCGVCGARYPVLTLAEDCEIRHLGRLHPDRRVVSIVRRAKPKAPPPRPPIERLAIEAIGAPREILNVAAAQYELETVATLMSGLAKLLEGR